MSVRLAFFAPWPELAELVRQIAMERKEDVIVFEGLDAYKTAGNLLHKEGVEAIIARGPTVDLLRQNFSLPVINCDPTAFDLLKAFSEARQFAANIGFITSWKLYFDKNIIENILGISIRISKLCRDKEDIQNAVQWAVDLGLSVVVGGTITYEIAPANNLKCIKLLTSSEAIAESFDKAKETARVIREKQAETERLRIILDLERNGIISINEKKIVTLFNSTAEEMTGIIKERIIGKSIEEFPALNPIVDVMEEKKDIIGEITVLGNIKVVNNRVPIIVNDQVVGAVSTYQDITQLQETEANVRKELNKKGFTAKCSINKLIGKSKSFRATIAEAEEYAKKDSTILILGETGCGKGLLAQGIHLASRRAKGPFVSINCSALPENLLESELFGFEEGSFSGARRGGKQGLFELAHNGTIFLDEIAGTSLHMQSRLLKIVQDREVMRVGGEQVIPLNVRIIAASNQDLKKEISQGRFRADLFYRLNVLSLRLPPLRERKEDIGLLFRHFLACMGITSTEIESILDARFSSEVENYSWPGNVRELEHFAEKTAALYRGASILIQDRKKTLLNELREIQNENLDTEIANAVHIPLGTLDEMENEIIRILYRKFYGNKLRLAKQLGISRTTLWKRLDTILHDDLLR
jgi:PAS domain S-box-containing protein